MSRPMKKGLVPAEKPPPTNPPPPNRGMSNGCYNGHDFRVASELGSFVKIFCGRCGEVRQI